MAVESPVTTAAISRRPFAEINTAALLIMMNVAFWMESPIMDLLTTSTTLAGSKARYEEITRFVIYLMLLVTAAHAILAFTPLYWVVSEGVIGVSHEIAAHARVGLMFMLPWAACIGWRRYLQGILIRFGHTRFVGLGTGFRVAGVSLASIALFYWTRLPGTEMAGIALMCGVGSEAAFIHWASRRVIREKFHHERAGDAADVPPLGMRKLVAFHLPLSLTTVVLLCGTPIVSAALARMPNSVLNLAAYQVGSSFLWMFRSFTYALPEVVITLYKNADTAKTLSLFCAKVGAVASAALLLLAFTGLDRRYFVTVLGATPEIAFAAHLAFIFGALMPLAGATRSYVQGMLTAHHLTMPRLVAIATSVVVLAAGLAVGVLLRADGVVAASVAGTLSLVAEVWVLAIYWNRGKSSLGLREPAL